MMSKDKGGKINLRGTRGSSAGCYPFDRRAGGLSKSQLIGGPGKKNKLFSVMKLKELEQREDGLMMAWWTGATGTR